MLSDDNNSETDQSINSLPGFVFHHGDADSEGPAPGTVAARAVKTVQRARRSSREPDGSLLCLLSMQQSSESGKAPARRGTIYQDSRQDSFSSDDDDDDAMPPVEIPVVASSRPSSRPPSRQSGRSSSSSSSPTPYVPSKKNSPSSSSSSSPTLTTGITSATSSAASSHAALSDPALSSPVEKGAALPKPQVVVSSVETAIKSAKSAIVKSRALLDGSPPKLSRSLVQPKSRLSSSFLSPSDGGASFSSFGSFASPGAAASSPKTNETPTTPLLPLSTASASALHPELLRLSENFNREMERHRQAIEDLSYEDVDDGNDDSGDDEDFGEDEDESDAFEDEESGGEKELRGGHSSSDAARSGNAEAGCGARVSFARSDAHHHHHHHHYPQVERQLATVGATLGTAESPSSLSSSLSPGTRPRQATATSFTSKVTGGDDELPTFGAAKVQVEAEEATKTSAAVGSTPPTTPTTTRRSSAGLLSTTTTEGFGESSSISSTGVSADLSQSLIEEHRLFVKAVFQLLAERDGYSALADGSFNPQKQINLDGGREGQIGSGSPPGIIKCGSLKKANNQVRAVWKTKYVRITRGLFSYYDDVIPVQSNASNAGGSKTEKGKHIVLRAGAGDSATNGVGPPNQQSNNSDGENGSLQPISCRAVALNSVNPLHSGGFCFEIVSGGTSRLWMAISREERASWIRAVHSAIIGSSTSRSTVQYEDEYEKGGVPTRDPLRNDMRRYQTLQNALKSATGREDYLQGLRIGLKTNEGNGVDLLMCVPVHWIRQQFEDVAAAASQRGKVSGGFVAAALGQHQAVSKAPSAFLESSQSAGIAQLWKDMQRDSVCLNGEVYNGGDLGPEAIVGALTRSIIECDGGVPLLGGTTTFLRRRGLTELQAVTFARDILLACNRTRSGGDTYFCVDMLTRRPDLVVLCPHSSFVSPLEITVQKARSATSPPDRGFAGMNPHSRKEKSGWLFKRGNSRKAWKRQFFVLSEGILSYYERAEPRPVCLRGQIVLVGATLETIKGVKDSDFEPAEDGRQQQNGESKDTIILQLTSREKELQFRFDDEAEHAAWEATLASEISAFDDVPSSNEAQPRDRDSEDESDREVVAQSGKSTPPGKSRVLVELRKQKSLKEMFTPSRMRGMLGTNASAHATQVANGAASSDSSPESTPPSGGKNRALDIVRVVDLDAEAVHNEGGESRKNDCLGIEVVVRAKAVYKICTIDPEGEDDDTWAVLLAIFEQRFLLSRGGGGSADIAIVKGNETVSLQFFHEESKGCNF